MNSLNRETLRERAEKMMEANKHPNVSTSFGPDVVLNLLDRIDCAFTGLNLLKAIFPDPRVEKAVDQIVKELG